MGKRENLKKGMCIRWEVTGDDDYYLDRKGVARRHRKKKKPMRSNELL